MEQWIANTLPLTPDKNSVELETWPDGQTKVSCEVTTLASLLGSVAVPPTHVALSALPVASAGWQQYFDAWKTVGYIS